MLDFLKITNVQLMGMFTKINSNQTEYFNYLITVTLFFSSWNMIKIFWSNCSSGLILSKVTAKYFFWVKTSRVMVSYVYHEIVKMSHTLNMYKAGDCFVTWPDEFSVYCLNWKALDFNMKTKSSINLKLMFSFLKKFSFESLWSLLFMFDQFPFFFHSSFSWRLSLATYCFRPMLHIVWFI